MQAASPDTQALDPQLLDPLRPELTDPAARHPDAPRFTVGQVAGIARAFGLRPLAVLPGVFMSAPVKGPRGWSFEIGLGPFNSRWTDPDARSLDAATDAALERAAQLHEACLEAGAPGVRRAPQVPVDEPMRPAPPAPRRPARVKADKPPAARPKDQQGVLL
jgi:hypothetical protein